MYDLVYAVNQQYPESGNPGGLLVLTKFAELVINSNFPRARVGNKRFCAMTRMTRNTINKHLKELKTTNFLVPLDNSSDKHKGDLPVLYELRLPEGFDQETVMKRHRNKYYGGKYFDLDHIDPTYLDIGEETILLPVSARLMSDAEASKIDKPMSKIDTDMSEIDKTMSKIAPSNKLKNNNNINNKFHAPDDADDDDFLKEYYKETNLSPAFLKKLGITRENVHLLETCVTYWKDVLRNNKANIRNPTGLLISIIQRAIANGKLDCQFGPIQSAPASQTFDEYCQSIELQQKIKEDEDSKYEYPDEVKSGANQIVAIASSKFNIKLESEILCNRLDRYISSNSAIIAQLIKDFKENCNLHKPTNDSLMDWIHNWLLSHNPHSLSKR